MRTGTWLSAAALGALCAAAPIGAQQVGDTNRIIDEGLNRSEVMETAQQLTDGIGGRLTNSPAMRRAEAWAIDKLNGWKLTNVHREGFEFGRGWEIIASRVTMVSPRPLVLTHIPVAWTPGTDGELRAPVIVAPMSKEKHFDAWRGKLAGKIVMVSLPDTGSEPGEAPFQRLSSEEIGELDTYKLPVHDPDAQNRRLQRVEFAEKLDAFLKSEGALAWVRKSYRDGKLISGEGYTYRTGNTPSLPGIEIAAEDYRRLARLAKSGEAPVLAIDSQVRFDDSDSKAYNILADIPGSDPRAGYVMAGAHFDSWIAGDGAADNGAGSVVVMEAARILKSLGVRPRRTIRFALWGAEEQGLLGSLAYIDTHLAKRPGPIDGEDGNLLYYDWPNRYPITPLADYNALKAYFNIDNGSGKLRGIYAEGNVQAVPLLRKWLSPFAAMGADAVVAEPTQGTDHVYMQSVGLPAFQFIQDPLDYDTRVHHSNVDTFDHLKAEDLRQASVILAAMLLQAANSDEVLPRMPLPAKPRTSDPFKYKSPDDE